MHDEKLMITGPVGELEALVSEVAGATTMAVICHPHPQHQGTMTNKVVTTMAKAYQLLGVSTVRFNYRGVGRSDGEYGEMAGEIADCRAVVDYAEQRFGDLDLHLAGFSFGAYIAASVANELNPQALVSIAPAVHHACFDDLTRVRCPWLVVMGEKDEIVPLAQVQQWVANPPSPLQFQLMPNASHFFHGELIHLRQVLVDFLRSIVAD